MSEIQFANTKSPGKWRGKQFLGDDGANPFDGGGGSTDTWVLEDRDYADRAGPPIADTLPPALPDLRYGEWTGQQQQQQQKGPNR